MKRNYFSVMLALFLACLLVGCAGTSAPQEKLGEAFLEEVNQLEGVAMESVEGSVSSTGVTISLRNDTQEAYSYGAEYDLQKLVGDSWYSVPYIIDNYGFPAIAMCLLPGENQEEIDWESFHGVMEEGTYRIVKSVFEESDYTSRHYLGAEFTIS